MGSLGRKRAALVLFVLVAATAFADAARAQISPGPLAKAHRDLEGVRKCLKCHKLGSGPSAKKCLDCHGEIAVRMKKKKGYHHVAVNVRKQSCFECHSDHAGRDFLLIQWRGGREHFDHGATGWRLNGKHASADCRKCHNPRFIQDDFSQFERRVNLSSTFLGLGDACVGCHFDEHRGKLGKNCEKCHTSDAWKPATRFDHAKTKFPLYGAHRKAKCARCHPVIAEARKGDRDNRFTKFKKIAHDRCTRCHFDEHRGQLSPRCQECHNREAWNPIPRFDHDKTKYPLTGKHASVGCIKCHAPLSDTNERDANNRYLKLKPIVHDRCVACHKDPHKDKFGQKCEKCHRTSGWKNIVRKNFDHSRTKFPLKGRHARVECVKCHKKDKKMIGLAFKNCSDCHKDVHRGQFAKSRSKGACDVCHDENGFKPSTFTSKDHEKTRFKLSGAHLAQPCIRCHKMVRAKGGKKFMKFRFDGVACTECHEDIHRGQFTASRPRKSCEKCHAMDAWKPLPFDHDKNTSYPLEGEHRYVPCNKCHTFVRAKGKRFIRYRPLDHSCASCHSRTDLKLRRN